MSQLDLLDTRHRLLVRYLHRRQYWRRWISPRVRTGSLKVLEADELDDKHRLLLNSSLMEAYIDVNSAAVGPFVRDCEAERLFLCCVVRVGYWPDQPVVRSRVVASFPSDSCFAACREFMVYDSWSRFDQFENI
ncbi:hypothetical protein Taro_026294 [Colocasia esculenta]|uniref:Uncharacterized protein n=1 Tax=Colocasia esculenta TaxID=4460 RepID=A0A843VQX1_COLES|nr:hypothetical protein [Colocasia esculenta]